MHLAIDPVTIVAIAISIDQGTTTTNHIIFPRPVVSIAVGVCEDAFAMNLSTGRVKMCDYQAREIR